MTASWAWITGACVLAAVLLAGAAWWGDRPEPAHAAPRRPRRAGDDEDAVTVEWHRSLRTARVRAAQPLLVQALRLQALRSVLDGPLGAALLLPVSLRCGRCARGRRQPCACARYCGVVVCMAGPDCPSPARAGYPDGRVRAASPDAVRRAGLAGPAIGYGPSYTPPLPVTWDEAWAACYASAPAGPLPPLPALPGISEAPPLPSMQPCCCAAENGQDDHCWECHGGLGPEPDAGVNAAGPLPPLPVSRCAGCRGAYGVGGHCNGNDLDCGCTCGRSADDWDEACRDGIDSEPDPARWCWRVLGHEPPHRDPRGREWTGGELAPACSDPPAESCADAGCPLHGPYDAGAEDAHRAVLDFTPCPACGGGPSDLHGECTDMTPAERERWPHLSRPWADTTGTFPAVIA